MHVEGVGILEQIYQYYFFLYNGKELAFSMFVRSQVQFQRSVAPAEKHLESFY